MQSLELVPNPPPQIPQQQQGVVQLPQRVSYLSSEIDQSQQGILQSSSQLYNNVSLVTAEDGKFVMLYCYSCR